MPVHMHNAVVDRSRGLAHNTFTSVVSLEVRLGKNWISCCATEKVTLPPANLLFNHNWLLNYFYKT